VILVISPLLLVCTEEDSFAVTDVSAVDEHLPLIVITVAIGVPSRHPVTLSKWVIALPVRVAKVGRFLAPIMQRSATVSSLIWLATLIAFKFLVKSSTTCAV
jgi:hypothetical protein